MPDTASIPGQPRPAATTAPAEIPLIVDHVARVVRTVVPTAPRRHLDVGAGWGHLIARLRAAFPELESRGIDYNPAHFELDGVPIAHGDFNVDVLPHPDGEFDLVTCTEVVEHLENYRHVLREAARVLRPGGVAGRVHPQRAEPEVPVAWFCAWLPRLF